MTTFEVCGEPDFCDDVFVYQAVDASRAVERYVQEKYDADWSDKITLYARNTETGEAFAVDVTARMELVVETGSPRNIG